MPQPHIVNSLLRKMATLPGYPALRVLDLSCGEGEVLSHLHAAGCECYGSRFRPDDYVIRTHRELSAEIKIDDHVDLHKPLPYEDGEFDVVIMTEVLEHLGTHLCVIREAGRLLRPGGYFLATTPNIQRLHSRFHFFLTGTHKIIRRRTGWDLKPDDLYAYHINPVSFPLMHTLLFQGGMRVSELAFTMFKLRHAYWFLFYPLFSIATWLTIGGRRKDSPGYRTGERDLRRWMLHPAMLGSEQLFVVARRQPQSINANHLTKAA